MILQKFMLRYLINLIDSIIVQMNVTPKKSSWVIGQGKYDIKGH